MTIAEKAAVILSKADTRIKEAFEHDVDMYYRAACRLKVKMPMRPCLVAPPPGFHARRVQPDDAKSQETKAKRAKLAVIRGGHSAGHEHPDASEVQS